MLEEREKVKAKEISKAVTRINPPDTNKEDISRKEVTSRKADINHRAVTSKNTKEDIVKNPATRISKAVIRTNPAHKKADRAVNVVVDHRTTVGMEGVSKTRVTDARKRLVPMGDTDASKRRLAPMEATDVSRRRLAPMGDTDASQRPPAILDHKNRRDERGRDLDQFHHRLGTGDRESVTHERNNLPGQTRDGTVSQRPRKLPLKKPREPLFEKRKRTVKTSPQ